MPDSKTIQKPKTFTLDEETGLPLDYHSFFAAYRPLMLATAKRVHIPPQDREDAAQEVAIKFWQKNGLDMYDPERKTKFATLLRNWAALFMLQERDKVAKNLRNTYIDPAEWAYAETNLGSIRLEAEEFLAEWVSDTAVEEWVGQAQTALERVGKAYLVPVLNLCVSAAEAGKAPSRAQIAQVAGVKIAKATPLIKELRQTLTDAGLGMESLYS